MHVALGRTMTLDDFLPWDAAQAERHEVDGLQPVAMNGGTVAHLIIRSDPGVELAMRLRGTSCRPYGPTFDTPA